MQIKVKGLELTLSEKITDLHVGTIQAFLSESSSPKKQEEFAYLIKNILFEEDIPDTIVYEKNGKTVLAIAGADAALIGVSAIQLFYEKTIEKLKVGAEPEAVERLNGVQENINKSIEEIKARWQLIAVA